MSRRILADVNIAAIVRESSRLKKALIALGLVVACLMAATALHLALTTGATVFAGKRPSNLGVSDGRLAAPKRSPNSVSSQADPGDTGHYIAPLKFVGSAVDAMGTLHNLIAGTERTLILKQDANYLYAEYKSRLFGFVDDVEFLASEKDGVIHVRSASRLGRRDYGVNRERMESIRERFEAAQPR